MNATVKLVLYIVLVALAAISGFFALSRFGEVMNTDRSIEIDTDRERPPQPSEPSPPPEPPATNLVSTNAALTNLASTNLVSTNATNQLTAQSKSRPATNEPAPPPVAKAAEEEDTAIATALGGRGPATSGKKGGVGLWMALFIISLIGLGILLALDISNYFGNRALRVLYNDEGEGMSTPEYDAAEQVWANGKHLEAIGMMRDYLNKNPREQYVAIRIAEIYEKDLGNYLAAALEYEEVLKHKLNPERWGWAAIHLCNLYFKLDQEEKAYALLRRLVDEYPDVAAAEKARKRLDQVGGAEFSPSNTILNEDAPPSSTPAQPNPGSLPPGFRKKK